MNNDIKNEIDWLYKSYTCRIEKALIMPTPEHWQLASTGYNHLSGFRDGLQAVGMKEEANYLTNLLKINLDK